MNSQDVFIKSNTYELKNGIIHLNLSESNQNGGNINDNIIHLSISTDNVNDTLYQNGGASDTSDYFNKLAEKIVNSKITQKGGFNVITTVDESSEIFLSSETINEIKNTSMTGGAKKNKSLNFNFNDLKRHLLKVSEELQGGSDDEDEDEDEDIFDDDTDDEDEDEEKEIKKLFEDTDNSDSQSLENFFKEKQTAEEKDIKKISKSHKISMESHRTKKPQQKRSNDDDEDENETESDDDLDIDLDSDDEDDKMKNKENKKPNKTNTLDSESLGSSSTQYQFSDSISSPKLISYRKIQNNTQTGRRFL
jgi:hypothetical protein